MNNVDKKSPRSLKVGEINKGREGWERTVAGRGLLGGGGI